MCVDVLFLFFFLGRTKTYVRRSGLKYVILRMAPLNDVCDDEELGRPVLTESPEASGWITPRGAAELVTTCLGSGTLAGWDDDAPSVSMISLPTASSPMK